MVRALKRPQRGRLLQQLQLACRAMDGLSLMGNAKVLSVRPLELVRPPAAALPAVKKGRPALTSKSLHDMRMPAARPLWLAGQAPPVAVPDVREAGGSAGQMSPPATLKLATRVAIAQREPRKVASSWPPSTQAAIGIEGAAAPSGTVGLASSVTLAEGPATTIDPKMIEMQRLKAVRRLREQREKCEREQEEERSRTSELKAMQHRAQQKLKDQHEVRDQRRAEVYALNKLYAARDEAAFVAFALLRPLDEEAVEQRHEEDLAAFRTVQGRLDAVTQKRLKARMDELKQNRADAKAEAEAEAEAKASQRLTRQEEIRNKEQDRELWRAQVYAINKLMAARDAAQFAEFKRARGIVDDEPPAEPAASSAEGGAGFSSAGFGSAIGGSAIGGKAKKRKKSLRDSLSQTLPAGTVAASISRSPSKPGAGATLTLP